MKILNPQQNRQYSQGNDDQAGSSNVSTINQQILEKLKEQQQLRMNQKKMIQQEYQSEPVHTQNLHTSGQLMRTSDIKNQSLNESKNLFQSSQTQQKIQALMKSKSSNNYTSQNQSISESSPAKDHLLVMTIDLGEGKTDVLHIYEYDEPIRKASEFCQMHGLTKEAKEILAKNIEVNKKIVLAERQHALYHSTQYLRTQGSQYGSNQTDNYYSNTSQQAIRSTYYRNASMNDEIAIEQSQQYEQSSPQKNIHQKLSTKKNHNSSDDYQVIHPQEKQSIFDRLHGEAAVKQQRIEQKKKQKNEQSQMSNSTYRSTKRVLGDTVVNLGEYLYQKGEQLKESKKKNIEEQLVQRQIEQDKSHSFKPEIDPTSVKLCQNKRTEMGEKTEDVLIKKGQIYKEKKDIKKYERENEKLNGCTFKPEVNQMSQYLYDLKKQDSENPSEAKFDQLHKESIRRTIRQEERETNSEYTFQPQINRQQKQLELLPFVDRMMKSATDKQKKIEDLKIKQQLEQQSADEQSTFKPQVGRAPQNRNQNNLAVHEYLYQKKDEKKLKQDIKAKEEKVKQKQQMATSLDKSNQIVEATKKNKLFDLFNQLDNDGDGQISSQNIDVSQVPKNILSVFAPLFCVMEENNYVFNFETFYENSLKIIDTLTIAQKDELFHNFSDKWEQKKSQYNQYEFRPNLNEKSLKLARKRSYEKIDGVYNHGMSVTQLKNDKLNKMKQEKAQKELDQCTFKPQLYKPMNIYPFTDPKNAINDNNFFQVHSGFEQGDGHFRVIQFAENQHSGNSSQLQ